MKAIVCGGRTFNDVGVLWEVLDKYHPDWVIQGGALGADYYAKEWATRNNAGNIQYAADWDSYGRKAGPMRNKDMLKENPDIVIAFPGGRGTKNMIKQARKAGVKVVRIKVSWTEEEVE